MIERFNYSQQNTLGNLELKESLHAYLSLPDRINTDKSKLPIELGDFLVDKNIIRGIDVWRNSWGFKYENNKIYIAENEMPAEQYKYYIFRLGIDPDTQEALFPKPDETDQYRFLHEVSHAYQEYLMKKESPDNPNAWYTRVLNNQIDSNYAILWLFCFKKREQNNGGFSTWGNVPDYNTVADPTSQRAVRAVEDANELVTMYLWNPNYFKAFLDYLSCAIDGYSDDDLERDGLIKLSSEEKVALSSLVEEYVNEIRNDIYSVKNIA